MCWELTHRLFENVRDKTLQPLTCCPFRHKFAQPHYDPYALFLVPPHDCKAASLDFCTHIVSTQLVNSKATTPFVVLLEHRDTLLHVELHPYAETDHFILFDLLRVALALEHLANIFVDALLILSESLEDPF